VAPELEGAVARQYKFLSGGTSAEAIQQGCAPSVERIDQDIEAAAPRLLRCRVRRGSSTIHASGSARRSRGNRQRRAGWREIRERRTSRRRAPPRSLDNERARPFTVRVANGARCPIGQFGKGVIERVPVPPASSKRVMVGTRLAVQSSKPVVAPRLSELEDPRVLFLSNAMNLQESRSRCPFSQPKGPTQIHHLISG